MEYSEQPRQVEHAYNVSQKREERRKLMKTRVKTLLATGVAAATFLGVGKVMEQASAEKDYSPDSYYNGKVEVVMSDNLRVRESPIVIINGSEQPNTVDWDEIEAIKSQGNWVDIRKGNSFVVDKPIITKGDDPMSEGAGKGSWLTFDARVNNEDEKLYVSLSAATSDYVKPIESGTFIKLDSLTSNQDLGKVTVNP